MTVIEIIYNNVCLMVRIKGKSNIQDQLHIKEKEIAERQIDIEN